MPENFSVEQVNSRNRILITEEQGKFHALHMINDTIPTRLSVEEKILIEFNDWVTALQNTSRSRLNNVCKALVDLPTHTKKRERIYARTLYMMQFFQALLVEPKDRNKLSANPFIETAARIDDKNGETPELHATLQRIRAAHFPLPDGTNKTNLYVSLPLLLITAVGFSQCEQYRPIVWEAYSAIRAQSELLESFGNIDSFVIDLVSFFIRYQSAAGQRSRGSGNADYLNVAQTLTDKYPNVTKDILVDALNLFGIIEIARPHSLTGIDIVLSNKNNSSSRNLTSTINRVLAPDSDYNGPTWCYFSNLGTDKQDKKIMAEFKTLFIEKMNEILPEYAKVKTITTVSFNRRQVVLLGELLFRCVREIVENKKEFRDFFQIKKMDIPNLFSSSSDPEFVIEIKLYGYIAAKQILYGNIRTTGELDGNGESNDAEKIKASDINTAGKLLVEMYKLAKESAWKKTRALSPRQDRYIPFAFLTRILNTVYRLQPRSCMAVAIRFDRTISQTIYIPNNIPISHPLKDEILDSISHYIPSFILNRAMSKGYKLCDIDLDGLVEQSSENPDFISGQQWQQAIKKAFKENRYNKLTEEYINNYNKERKTFQISHIPDEVMQHVDIKTDLESMHEYLNVNFIQTDMTPLFLGVDIGGTFTKVQFYKYDQTTKKFIPFGNDIKMLTPAYNKKDVDPEDKEKEISALEIFCRKLIENIHAGIRKCDELNENKPKKVVISIGISFPAAVRNNHIAGTAGSLSKFGLDYTNTTIEQIMDIDVCEELRQQWQKSGIFPAEQHETSVFMLNDGNAEALGNIHMYDIGATKNAVVIKLGTGTAGAVVIGGKLQEGPAEWGKMMMNIGSKKNSNYPNGLANRYLSAKTLPELVQNLQTDKPYSEQLFRVNKLSSLELGLILECVKNNYNPKSICELIHESGIQVLVDTLENSVDIDVIRSFISDNKPFYDRDITQMFENKYKKLGYRGIKKKLKEDIILKGCSRVGRMLAIDNSKILSDLIQDSNNTNLKPSRVNKIIENALATAYQDVTEAVNTLGIYLGDFISIIMGIYDDFDISTIILCGGVLSNTTGEIAREKARDHLEESYQLNFKIHDKLLIHSEHPEVETSYAKTEQQEKRLNTDAGQLGAAVYGAMEHILDLKIIGLIQIKYGMNKMMANDELEISDDQVTIKYKINKITDSDELNVVDVADTESINENEEKQETYQLARNALTKDEAIVYINHIGSNMGISRMVHTKSTSAKFIRWAIPK